jgi:hypothetical protein
MALPETEQAAAAGQCGLSWGQWRAHSAVDPAEAALRCACSLP